MNIQEYMINPMGRGSSVLMLSETRRSLDIQYASLVSKMSMTWYLFQDKYFIAHVKVPSRSVEGLFYDVLIEIDTDSIPENSTIINSGNARVFSNCPSFVYTYAKLFNDDKDLIPWTLMKYNHQVFESDPVKRNPIKIINYERSLYFAIKYITTNGRNYKNRVRLNLIKKNHAEDILRHVNTTDEVIELYRTGRRKAEEKKKVIHDSSEDNRAKESSNQKKPSWDKPKNITKNVQKTRSTSKVSKVKSTKKMKHY
jgi:hypothetical protein